jgi:gluconolactonase
MVFAVVVAFSLGAGSLVSGQIEVVAEGHQFTEGPVWTTDGELIFSDIPADTVYRADKSIVFRPSGNSNGLTLDGDGRVIRCEHANRRVVRVEKDGSITILADAYDGRKLNSPNDAIWRSDGTVFFTDPPYGLGDRPSEQPVNGVYAIEPAGRVRRIAEDFERPNGIALSPDGNRLYVADSQRGHIRAFSLDEKGNASGGEELCKVPSPDGIRVDTEGRIWATSLRGVVVFTASGTELETIAFPQIPANCAFGGRDGKTLFATARTGVYSVQTGATGLVGGWPR